MAQPHHPTAASVAASVRSGATTATSLLEQHLAAIGNREAEVHAFNLVTTELAREQAAAVDAKVAAGTDPGPLAFAFSTVNVAAPTVVAGTTTAAPMSTSGSKIGRAHV